MGLVCSISSNQSPSTPLISLFGVFPLVQKPIVTRRLLLLKVSNLVRVLVAVGRTSVALAAGADGGGEALEDVDGGVPVNAGVGDGDALLEGGGALGGHLLVALVDVGLDHDANDGLFALAELVANDGGDLGLVAVVLVGVACVVLGLVCI